MHYNKNTQCFYSVNFGASQGAWEREMAVSPLNALGICACVMNHFWQVLHMGDNK